MRTYAKNFHPDGTYTWVVVQTDAQGYDDAVWATTLIQCMESNLGESPFYATWALGSLQAVQSQIPPDAQAASLQAKFAPYFASLQISRLPTALGAPLNYQVNILFQSGATLTGTSLEGWRLPS